MTDNRITIEQAAALGEKIGPMLAYLGRLQQRMDKTGRHADELYPLVEKAHNAIHHLSVELHYRTCRSGVGRPSE